MANHYNTAIVPARVKHPDGKPNAEGSVKFTTIWILSALHNYHFFFIEKAKTAISEKVKELNTRSLTKRAGHRRIAFENMGSLPCQKKNTAQREPVCIREHMPPVHQKYLAYNPEEFIYWGGMYG